MRELIFKRYSNEETHNQGDMIVLTIKSDNHEEVVMFDEGLLNSLKSMLDGVIYPNGIHIRELRI